MAIISRSSSCRSLICGRKLDLKLQIQCREHVAQRIAAWDAAFIPVKAFK